MPKRIHGCILAAIASKREYQRLIPTEAIQILQNVMEYGEKRGKIGWQNTPVKIHLARAKKHIEMFEAGDRSEWHLRHAFARLMMAAFLQDDRADNHLVIDDPAQEVGIVR